MQLTVRLAALLVALSALDVLVDVVPDGRRDFDLACADELGGARGAGAQRALEVERAEHRVSLWLQRERSVLLALLLRQTAVAAADAHARRS